MTAANWGSRRLEPPQPSQRSAVGIPPCATAENPAPRMRPAPSQTAPPRLIAVRKLLVCPRAKLFRHSLPHLRELLIRGKLATEAYRTDEPPYLSHYATVAATGQPLAFEAYFPPLQRHFYIIAFSPTRGQFATLFQDITDRKRTEAQLQEYAERLEQMVAEKVRQLDQERAKVLQLDKLASLGQLATSVAHELNQPLAAIAGEAGYLILLARKLRAGELPPLDWDELEGLGAALEADVERARRITDHLRAFGRVTETTQEAIDLNTPLTDSLIILKAQLRSSRVATHLHLAEQLPLIQANPYRLEQVFLNLISNAEYALNEAAEQDGREKTLTLSTRQEGTWVVAEVHDNGCGMSEEIQTRLFEPFFTTKPVGQGTGLGLSICYNIVAECGGDITCASVVGAGTTFTLRFPIALPRPAESG